MVHDYNPNHSAGRDRAVVIPGQPRQKSKFLAKK
jgi:hypothetical protein